MAGIRTFERYDEALSGLMAYIQYLGCFFFLEKVREGIYDNYLEELYKARPPANRKW